MDMTLSNIQDRKSQDQGRSAEDRTCERLAELHTMLRAKRNSKKTAKAPGGQVKQMGLFGL